MPEWEVIVPIAGYAIVRVEADSKEAAIDAAFKNGVGMEDIEMWDAYEHICEGNIFYPDENDAVAMMVEED